MTSDELFRINMTPRELFEIIEKKTDFTKITEEGINEDSVYSAFAPVLEYFKSIGVHVFLGTGVSKAAFVFADEDFVFKIPFDYEVNEGVELGDYCAIEAEYYHDAEIDGVDAYFAKTYLYDFIRHDGYKVIPVYYQEKATPLEETQSMGEYYAEMDSLSKEKKQELNILLPSFQAETLPVSEQDQLASAGKIVQDQAWAEAQQGVQPSLPVISMLSISLNQVLPLVLTRVLILRRSVRVTN